MKPDVPEPATAIDTLEESEISVVTSDDSKVEPGPEEAPGAEPEDGSVAEQAQEEPTSEGDASEADTAEADPAEVDAEADTAEVASGEPEVEDDVVDESKGPGPGEDMTDDELVRAVAALVFASPDPLGTGRLWNLLERPRKERVKNAIEQLGERLESSGLPFELRPIAGGWRMLTKADHAEVILRLSKVRKNERISHAALETLAIVAYRQPVTKAEIEAIRGVQAGALLRSLTERGLVKVAGRADQPGAPLQYGTTREFLDRFGLEGLKDLPRDGELLGG